MKLSKKSVIFYVFCALTALWICIIFANSAETATESGEKSESLTRIINEIFAFFGIKLTVPESLLRNLGHFCEYAFLSLLLCADFSLLPTKDSEKSFYYLLVMCPVSLPFCFCVSLIDEFVVQKATEGRAPDWADVLTDMSGAALSVLHFIAFCYILFKIKARKYKKQLN